MTGSSLSIRKTDRTRDLVVEPDEPAWRVLEAVLDGRLTINARCREIAPKPLKLIVTVFPGKAHLELSWSVTEALSSTS